MAGRWLPPLAWALASAVAFTAVALVADRRGRGAYPVEPTRDEEAQIIGALVDFHRVYEDFFASGGRPTMLDAVPATKEVKHQIFRDIGYLANARLVMVQDLASATVTRVERTGPGRAEAVVFEEWNYTLQQLPERKLLLAPKGLGQGFRYRLEREGGRWLVAGWSNEDIPAPADDGMRKW